MCLIIFAHRVAADYPLVVAANRDEFHSRATAAASYWPQQPDIFAGRDLQAGGTWMGVSRNGRFAAITNYRDPERTQPAPRSRGELATEYLLGQSDTETFLHKLDSQGSEYAGFNLLLGDGDKLWYTSNSGGKTQLLAPGIYGLSNALLDTPWPKVELGKQKLAETIAQDSLDHDQLASVVADRQLASREQLSLQGLGAEMDQLLSAQYIVNPQYGTRASTTCWRDSRGNYHWRELSINGAGETTGRVEETIVTTGESQATGL